MAPPAPAVLPSWGTPAASRRSERTAADGTATPPLLAVVAVLGAGLAATAIAFFAAAAPGASEGVPLRDSPPSEPAPFEAPANRVLPSNRPAQHIVLVVDDLTFAQVLRARHARDGLLAAERGATSGGSAPTFEVLVTAPSADLQTLLAAFAEFETQCTARAGDQPCPVLRFLDLRSRAVAPD